MSATTDARSLSDRMEFDHVIQVHEDGTVTDGPLGFYAPELYWFDGDDSHHLDGGGSWELLNGYSRQDRYSGPIMHASEQIGGAMERDILAEPGIYVALVCYVVDPDDEWPEPAGWAVARWIGGDR
jgi:hypothetical protein